MTVDVIRTKLLAKLNGLSSLKAAYNWETSNSGGNYPYATLTLRSGTGTFASTAHNLRIRGFRIRVYQEQTKAGQGPQQAEELAKNVIDELEASLDADVTLGGTCKYAKPVSWRAMYVDVGTDTRVLEINVDAYDLVTVR